MLAQAGSGPEPELESSQKQQRDMVGRWGEEVVYHFLLNQQQEQRQLRTAKVCSAGCWHGQLAVGDTA
jgi:hypothetical protein